MTTSFWALSARVSHSVSFVKLSFLISSVIAVTSGGGLLTQDRVRVHILRALHRIVLFAVHFLFDKAQNACYSESQHKVDYRDKQIRCESLVVYGVYRVRHKVQFGKTDNVKHRRIFDIDDELVRNRRKNIP